MTPEYEHGESSWPSEHPRPSPALPADRDRSATGLVEGDILSCVVQVRPGRGREVAERLAALPGVEVHAGVEVDRLVVTIEDVAEERAADRLGALTLVEGVIHAILIYHCDGRVIQPDQPSANPG